MKKAVSLSQFILLLIRLALLHLQLHRKLCVYIYIYIYMPQIQFLITSWISAEVNLNLSLSASQPFWFNTYKSFKIQKEDCVIESHKNHSVVFVTPFILVGGERNISEKTVIFAAALWMQVSDATSEDQKTSLRTILTYRTTNLARNQWRRRHSYDLLKAALCNLLT